MNMDAKEQARLRLAAQHLLALADGEINWVRTDPLQGCKQIRVVHPPQPVQLIQYPDEWRVAEPEPEKCRPPAGNCEWCGCNWKDHRGISGCNGKPGCKCKKYISINLAGPRPTPPDGCELLVPGMELADFWWAGDKWIRPVSWACRHDRPVWRARQKADPQLVSYHDMLVAHIRWHRADYASLDDQNHNAACDAFLAQGGGK